MFYPKMFRYNHKWNHGIICKLFCQTPNVGFPTPMLLQNIMYMQFQRILKLVQNVQSSILHQISLWILIKLVLKWTNKILYCPIALSCPKRLNGLEEDEKESIFFTKLGAPSVLRYRLRSCFATPLTISPPLSFWNFLVNITIPLNYLS